MAVGKSSDFGSETDLVTDVERACTKSILATIGVGIWYSLLYALIRILTPPPTPTNGIQKVISQWMEPGSSSQPAPAWLEDFTRDITPIPCHSHNDYWRAVPLYNALAAGCTGVEADIWLSDNELLVGHNRHSLRKHRTLRSLYIDPLISILENQNTPQPFSNSSTLRGVFDTNPNKSVALLLDFKTDGALLFPTVEEQLLPLRQKGYLTYFNGSTVVPGLITVVGTGNTPFDQVIANSTYRDIFFDAPLSDLAAESKYTSENSYYASVSLSKSPGRTWFNKLSSKQVDTIKEQIKVADDRGLVSRYWDIPAWPVSLRTSVWEVLAQNGVGLLNVDNLAAASRWNWKFCTVLGLDLC
ncbi:PLC-like phosphodiesterase [Venustampulla echinocandica]|uniref:Altered inheritance of mitochondria protein 6 n=1 Tax=Venustampulla echinocandica TaxID=2656787 RepID=A0A370U1U0_9HELO|nr:PLC-like phosphodiesterase [Venustampulla echinocandica]RDL41738.1 PLC-like phosphodiesterase [Venustampulla echinocandica]